MDNATPSCTPGWVLPSVIAIVLLVGLVGALGARQLWLQTQLLRYQAQRLHHRSVAQAALHWAVQDIQAAPVLADGRPNWRVQMGEATQTHVFYPQTASQRDTLRQRLQGARCRDGICVVDNPMTAQALSPPRWGEAGLTLATAWPVPAPALPDTAIQAVVWVDILVAAQDLPPPEADPALRLRFIYRITALTQGGWTGARAMAQGLWQANAAADGSPASDAGRWRSWQWLTP